MAECVDTIVEHESARPVQHTVAETDLKPGAIGLPGVLMQGVTAIAPAIAGMFTMPCAIAVPDASRSVSNGEWHHSNGIVW